MSPPHLICLFFYGTSSLPQFINPWYLPRNSSLPTPRRHKLSPSPFRKGFSTVRTLRTSITHSHGVPMDHLLVRSFVLPPIVQGSGPRSCPTAESPVTVRGLPPTPLHRPLLLFLLVPHPGPTRPGTSAPETEDEPYPVVGSLPKLILTFLKSYDVSLSRLYDDLTDVYSRSPSKFASCRRRFHYRVYTPSPRRVRVAGVTEGDLPSGEVQPDPVSSPVPSDGEVSD